LSGTLPAIFSDVPKLTDFYIDGNKLTGTIPRAICEKGLNKDFFDGTEQKSGDDCQNIACFSGTMSSDGLGPCLPCEDDFYNPYLGWDKDCIDVDTIHLLDTFYKKTSSRGWTKPWDLSDIHCHEPGITCDDMGHVVGINVKGFGLSGSIPEEIGFLRYLKALDLSDNDLTGFLPSDLRFAPLEKLDISGNKLIGVVPLMLCTKPGINGNAYGGSSAGCDHISCPVGYYSSTGAGSSRTDHKCQPCKGGGGEFLASKSCSNMSYAGFSDTAAKGFGFFLLGTSVVMLIIFVAKKILRRNIKNAWNESMEFERLPDGLEFS